jgi:hypothetical protein
MSKLLRVLALAALLAALHLAGSTAVAHANSGLAVIGDGRRPPTQDQVGEAWHRRSVAANQHPVAGDMRRPPTEGQVGEPWHPRVSVPMRPDEPTSQPGRLVAALAALAAAALALSGGLVAKRTGWRVRPQQTT